VGVEGVVRWSQAARVHYEAQVLGRRDVDGEQGMALEIGFHAEERDEALNQDIIERITGAEKRWRKVLGAETEVGEFFGAPRWRRASDVWLDPDLSDDDAAFEIAARLIDYITAFEPYVADHKASAS
jgi:hypothetical protein